MTVLTDGIASGRLAPGQRLVEAQLQAEHGAGRSTVREALRQLAAQGLVSVEANRGASVRRLSRSEVKDLFAIRERLEGLGASLAALRVRDASAPKRELAQLDALVTRMGHLLAAPDAMAWGHMNREFHSRLLQLSGNTELQRLVEQLSLPIFQQQFRGFLQPQAQHASHQQHLAIVQAVRAGRAGAAELAMRRHIRGGLALVMKWPDEYFDQPHHHRQADDSSLP